MSEVVTAAPEPVVPEEAFNPDMTDQELQRRLQVEVVDMSHGVVTSAKDHSAEFINRHTTEGRNVFTRFMKKVWHGNLARDYYALREQQRGVQQIVETGNVHALHDGTDEDHARTSATIIERVGNGYLHQDEVRQSVAEIDNGESLEGDLKRLVQSFASGNLSSEALVEEKTRLLQTFGQGKRKEDRNKGLLLADNIVEVAQNAKAALDHGLGWDRIEAALSAHHTEARMGARTQVRLNAAEKMADKLYQTKVGSLVNETTLAALASVPLIAGKLVTRKAATAAAATVTLGAGAAVVAGVRESYHIKEDRQAHMRDMATGGGHTLAHAGKRREQLEETRYETFRSQDVLADLQEARTIAGNGQDGLNDALDMLTFARTLVSQSDEKSVDLIQYSGRTEVETERLQIDVSIAEARAAVQAALHEASDDVRNQLGITSTDVGEVLDQRAAAVLQEINADMSVRDQAFRKLQRKQVVKAAAIGFVTSETIGLAMQEAKAAFSDSLQGVFEGGDGQDRRTLLAGIFHGDGTASPNAPTGAHNLVEVRGHGKVNLPEGYHLNRVEEGRWELVGADNKVIYDQVHFNKNGDFGPKTLEALRGHGFSFTEEARNVTDPDTVRHTEVTRSAAEYINHNKSEFTHVQRQLWYDNDTAGVYDRNELGLWWGGNEGVGVDEHGNYVFAVSSMSPDGSFHGDLSADYRQLIHEGKMSIALSMTDGTQDKVIMVPINEHGQAIIEKNSFAARSLFATQDGHAQFVGKYAEAVQIGDKQNGVQSMRMLATVVGEDRVGTVVDRDTHIVHHMHNEITTTLIPPVAEAPATIEVPGAIPLAARKGLEYADEPAEDYGYYANNYSPESLRRYDRYRSPRLEADPNARLNMGEEIDWYRQQIAQEPGGPDYLQAIDRIVQENPALSTFDPRTKALVCIPVGATSEADNIYNTLSQYAQQPEDAKGQTKILLHVNWFDDAQNDPAKAANIAKTLAEIEKAKQDFPDLDIADFQTEWKRAEHQNGGIIYDVVNRLYDTALASIDNAVKTGQVASDHDVLLIRNDADAQGRDRNYLARELAAAENNPDTDAFVSATRQGTESHKQYPGFGVVANMREVLDGVKSLLHKPTSTIGTNTAVRASSFAAIGGIRRDDGYHGAGSDDLEIGNRLYAARLSSYVQQVATAQDDYGTTNYGASARRASLLRRRRVAAYAAGYTPQGTPQTPATERRPIRYVVGANIDASPDRLLNTYRTLRPVTESWGSFDQGGHVDRTQVGNGSIKLNGENPRSINDIARRVEENYSAMFRVWANNDPDVIRMALSLAHGQGDDIYKVTWDGDGNAHFAFTDEGRKWLQNRLRRDSRGHFDSFGGRVRRQLYHETGRGSRKQPASRAPRFVKGPQRV